MSEQMVAVHTRLRPANLPSLRRQDPRRADWFPPDGKFSSAWPEWLQSDRVLNVSLGPRSREISAPELHSELSKTLVAHGVPAGGQTGILPMAAVIWSLVERQQVGAARQLLSSLPDAPEYRKLRELLRRPRTSLGTKKGSRAVGGFPCGCASTAATTSGRVGRLGRREPTWLRPILFTRCAVNSDRSAPQARPLIHFVR